ncbi:MAG: hypothetical protein MZV70_55530 [Desulfobacterales bacterium]|nr:hypothetical protein [Desulfobacterales bacterium]
MRAIVPDDWGPDAACADVLGVGAARLPAEHRLEVETHPRPRTCWWGASYMTVRRRRPAQAGVRALRAGDPASGRGGRPARGPSGSRTPSWKSRSSRTSAAARSRSSSPTRPSSTTPCRMAPLNTDNPGFGVTASITAERRVFLLAGAGWYPDLVDGQRHLPAAAGESARGRSGRDGRR